MDVFAKTINIKSRTDVLHIYGLGDLHKGAPNYDEARLKKTIRLIEKDTCHRIVFLLGDLCDAVVLKDPKRFTVDNLSDEVLTGTPKQIRRNISNLAANQAEAIAKLLMPIKDCCIAAVRGNHEMSVEKSCGISLHSIVCEKLGVRDSGDIGIACITLNRQGQARVIRVAYMHTASGGRTAGASNNSLCRAMNLFDADIVFQGHNHSPATQHITSIGTTNPSTKTPPSRVTRDRVGINNGSFLESYPENVNSYDQTALYNPKDTVFYRVNAKIVEEHHSREKFTAPKLSLKIEELHV